MAASAEFIKEFVAETREGLEQLNRDLVALESTPAATDRCDRAFRALHTIKGNAGFLDFQHIGELAHAGEAVLQRLRSGELTLNPSIGDVLFKLLDSLHEVLGRIERTGVEGDDTFQPLKSELRGIATLQAGSASAQPAAPDPSVSEVQRRDYRDLGETVDHVRPPLIPSDSEFAPVSNPDSATDFHIPAVDSQSETLGRGMSGSELSTVARGTSDSSVGTSMVRVDVDLLDRLMNLVGELVLARNQIVEMHSRRSDPAMLNPVQRLNVLTTELQAGVLKTRMYPIGNIWNRYPRIVRDLARQLGKEVKLELIGADTELDKALVEAISDPLIHLLRNAIDHGIERPQLRKIKLKPRQGQITLKAFHESGQVRIEISDDGGGLDVDKIRQKIVHRGFVSADDSLRMSIAELHNSIFLPGFSTSDQISSISGRGVGMDVVKTNIESVGGTIEIETEKDVGTTFRLTLPLTLAIIPALMVTCAGQCFAIPQTNVVEMLALRGSSDVRIELFHNSPVLRLRGDVLPVVKLAEQLRLRSGSMDHVAVSMADSGQDRPAESFPTNVMILKTGTRLFALVVDHIGNSEEIVVKPFGLILDGMPEYSGATILGDGSLALILNIRGVAQRAGLFATDRSRIPVAIPADHDKVDEPAVTSERSLLVVEIERRRRIAFSLNDVIRIERVPTSQVEFSDGQPVLQYRGEIVPMLFVDQALTARLAEIDRFIEEADELSLIIYGVSGRAVALVVQKIVDIADQTTPLPAVARTGPVAGTAVILGHVTDLIDVPRLTESAGIQFCQPV